MGSQTDVSIHLKGIACCSSWTVIVCSQVMLENLQLSEIGQSKKDRHRSDYFRVCTFGHFGKILSLHLIDYHLNLSVLSPVVWSIVNLRSLFSGQFVKFAKLTPNTLIFFFLMEKVAKKFHSKKDQHICQITLSKFLISYELTAS